MNKNKLTEIELKETSLWQTICRILTPCEFKIGRLRGSVGFVRFRRGLSPRSGFIVLGCALVFAAWVEVSAPWNWILAGAAICVWILFRLLRRRKHSADQKQRRN